jgi:hypothetical protein
MFLCISKKGNISYNWVKSPFLDIGLFMRNPEEFGIFSI